jgi:hypothetical protein
MASSTIVWIVVAVIALLVVIAIAAGLARKQRERSRIAKSDVIREQVRQDSVDVERREALARETAARARAAEAEAEAKAAEAERLKSHADKHFSHATDARSDLEERRLHADALDPRVTDTDDVDPAAQAYPDGAADRRGDAVPRDNPVGHNN